jgi:hypothetical protein
MYNKLTRQTAPDGEGKQTKNFIHTQPSDEKEQRIKPFYQTKIYCNCKQSIQIKKMLK